MGILLSNRKQKKEVPAGNGKWEMGNGHFGAASGDMKTLTVLGTVPCLNTPVQGMLAGHPHQRVGARLDVSRLGTACKRGCVSLYYQKKKL